MKTFATTFIILFISTSIFAQFGNSKSTHQKLDSTFYTGRRRDVYLYDSLMRNTEWIASTLHPINHTWMKGGRTIYEYNNNDQVIIETYYTGDDPFTSWNKTYKHEYFYDNNGRDTLKISYFWSSSNVWQNRFQEKYYYSTSGNLDSTSAFYWESGQSKWYYGGHVLRNYNSNDGLLLMVDEYIDQSTNSWSGNEKSTYTRDFKNRIYSETYQWWDYLSTGGWDNIVKAFNYYDVEGDLENIESYEWDYSYYYWELRNRYTTIFDTSISAQDIVLPLHYDIHGIGSKHYYYLKHKPIYGVNYYRTNQNSWALSGDSTLYYYSDIYTSIDETEKQPTISISPNPTTSFINIGGLDIQKKYQIRIYDVSGRLLIEKTISNAHLDLSSLNSGIYFLNISFKGRSVGKTKIIKN